MVSLSFLMGCTVLEPPPSNIGGASGAGGMGGQITAGTSGAGAGGMGGQITAGASGAGGGAGGAGIPPTFDTLKFVLNGTNPPCVASDCHGGTHMELPLLVVNDGLYTELTTYISVACGNIPIVTPGDPARSALVKVLKGPCGVEPDIIPRMPNGCIEDQFDNTCVPNDYIAALEQWVLNGAPQ